MFGTRSGHIVFNASRLQPAARFSARRSAGDVQVCLCARQAHGRVGLATGHDRGRRKKTRTKLRGGTGKRPMPRTGSHVSFRPKKQARAAASVEASTVARRDRMEETPIPMLDDFFSRGIDGAFAVDAGQRIIFWNPACAQLLRVSAREALGRPCGDVLRGHDGMGCPFCRPGCTIAQLAEGTAAPEAFPLWVSDGQGSTLRLSVSIMLVPSPRTKLWAVVHLLHRREAPAALHLLEGEGWRKRRAPKADAPATDPAGPPVPDSRLSSREQEVYRLLAEGLPVSTISHRLYISPVTVRNHLQHIMSKLGLHSQTAAVAYAYRHNLFQEP